MPTINSSAMIIGDGSFRPDRRGGARITASFGERSGMVGRPIFASASGASGTSSCTRRAAAGHLDQAVIGRMFGWDA